MNTEQVENLDAEGAVLFDAMVAFKSACLLENKDSLSEYIKFKESNFFAREWNKHRTEWRRLVSERRGKKCTGVNPNTCTLIEGYKEIWKSKEALGAELTEIEHRFFQTAADRLRVFLLQRRIASLSLPGKRPKTSDSEEGLI